MTQNSFDEFYRITKYDLKQYFQDYVDFTNTEYPKIVSYYNGGDVPRKSFEILDNMLKTAEEIEATFYLFSDQLNLLDYWEMLDNFEELWTKLLTIDNSGKWMRSSRVGRFSNKFYLDRGLGDFDNFEKVAHTAGYNNAQDSWEQIAVDNLIIEENYTPRNGLDFKSADRKNLFKISLSDTATFGIGNIVDSLVGENILGKDIDKRFFFDDNDLAVVKYRDAVEQTVDTILTTCAGDIPEFPEDGISNEFFGSNVAAFQYPTLFRNISSMFYKDNRFTEINLVSLSRKDDYVDMKLDIRTVNNDSILTNVNI